MLLTTEDCYEPTLNQKGFMLKKIDPFLEQFIDNLEHNNSNAPSLDVGAAYGIVTLKALEKNHNIIANDLSIDHLERLKERAQDLNLQIPQTLPGDFFEIPILPNSLYSICASRVLHFLPGDEIIRALQLFYQWLIPGGKAFIINETPFLGSAANYLPIYQQRKKEGHSWPGLFNDLSQFDPTKRPFLNGTIHLLDMTTCHHCIQESGFNLLNIRYYDRKGYFPDDAITNGQESIGFILQKPMNTYC